MTIVDRSVTATVHLEYAVPMEDTELTDDELEDSRTHQFFGFCRGLDPQVYLPRWITQADVDRATDMGIAPGNIEPANILESNTDLAGCWHRINADDDRRPITFAAADEGLDWDTTDLAAGNYLIEGYTWEPPLNIWSSRTGVIKVVDNPDPAASAPALGINNTEEVLDLGDTVTIEGCVSAEQGSTLTAYWALPEGEATWRPFIENDPVPGETFAVEFDPPEEAEGEPVMIRVDVTDPSGRRYTNYMRDLLYVLGEPDLPDCEEENVFVAAGCDETGSETGTSGTSTGHVDPTSGMGTTTSGPGQDGGDDAGGACGGCRVRDRGAPAWAGLLLLSLMGRRRRGPTSLARL
ncbi:MAG: hypothetical protein AAGF11_26780 [Myxococcota bacterium]